MDKHLLTSLVCPVTKGSLIYDKKNQVLISLSAQLAYSIDKQKPNMIEENARTLSTEEIEAWKKHIK